MRVLRARIILHNVCVETRRNGYVLQMLATALDEGGEKQFGPGFATISDVTQEILSNPVHRVRLGSRWCIGGMLSPWTNWNIGS